MASEEWQAIHARLRLGEKGTRCPYCRNDTLYSLESLDRVCLTCERIFDGVIFATYIGKVLR